MSVDVRDSVVELRQYTLQPGQRDTLIELFEREFIESQEACGMRLLGQFRDLDQPDRFVWLRAFNDMPARAQALAAFYGGPVWKAHRDAANATMIDSDNVLLLRPAFGDDGWDRAATERAPIGAAVAPAGRLIATIWALPNDATADFVTIFQHLVVPAWRRHGARVLAGFISEQGENTFPALPVREGENVFVGLSAYDDDNHHAAHRAVLALDPVWCGEILPELRRHAGEPQTLRLAPTPRSRLRG
jgi:quinol monooxygenase YgiN